MKEKRKGKIGFSVADLILLVLAVACFASVVFQDQIRTYLGEEPRREIRVVFLVENVTEEGHNHPVSGEEIRLASNQARMGTITDVKEKNREYQNVEDPDSKLTITTLTCTALMQATEKESGFEVAGVHVKPGETVVVETEGASFEMLVTAVELAEGEEE